MAAGAEEFCKDYLVINAKEATLFDIACILICSTDSLKKRAFYDERCEDVDKSTTVNRIRRRWLIFVFVILQKLFIWTETPLAFAGSFIETWLNLLSSNGGFFGLMINRIRGKVVKLKESSEKFVSMIGQIDTRLELDVSVKKGDGRYKPSLSIMAAKLCYENEAFVKAAVQDQLKVMILFSL
ncbi:hypothetical protein OSB04_005127 [Centaurea solstitialis]|uniref:Uncharacterized protein n=1 Tax=Centaurea solstitialis TaxID=347529 RepID=A0AA38WGH6_9ASTR|nr:hypothetical protein OSB04_005127 [Centaurea solstitialis]